MKPRNPAKTGLAASNPETRVRVSKLGATGLHASGKAAKFTSEAARAAQQKSVEARKRKKGELK